MSKQRHPPIASIDVAKNCFAAFSTSAVAMWMSVRRVCDVEPRSGPSCLLAPVPAPVLPPQPCAVLRQQRHWLQGYPDEREGCSGVACIRSTSWFRCQAQSCKRGQLCFCLFSDSDWPEAR
ncbi:unnamed protein product [Pleuronectes platessa]|uniref:Uncharacterized protein n=1 Tax=Pleuronectes platessa TaxID=8262 RepID=A0A9N7VUX9_PLEPL|nr:unnamed protein product [Pleuronectes platessa]